MQVIGPVAGLVNVKPLGSGEPVGRLALNPKYAVAPGLTWAVLGAGRKLAASPLRERTALNG